MDKAKKYNSRKWLNPESSPFTGSVVCHYSEHIEDGKKHINAFVELGGCHSKARIHHDWESEDTNEYINKVRKLKEEIDKYYIFLTCKL